MPLRLPQTPVSIPPSRRSRWPSPISRSTESQIADADLKLARTDVKTPVGGTVSDQERQGRRHCVATGDPLFTIIRDDKIELVAEVGESDIVKVQPGQKATLSLSGSREKVTGSVRLVSPTVDPLTRLGLVHIFDR